MSERGTRRRASQPAAHPFLFLPPPPPIVSGTCGHPCPQSEAHPPLPNSSPLTMHGPLRVRTGRAVQSRPASRGWAPRRSPRRPCNGICGDFPREFESPRYWGLWGTKGSAPAGLVLLAYWRAPCSVDGFWVETLLVWV